VGSSYADCFAALLQRLARRECRALQDPLGISGLVPACSTDAKRAMALRTVTASADRANGAVAAGRNGNVTEARRLWNLVFNDRFPR
jgi:dihydrodipicolinate synthase/N-acetylneuraminate lyase